MNHWCWTPLKSLREFDQVAGPGVLHSQVHLGNIVVPSFECTTGDGWQLARATTTGTRRNPMDRHRPNARSRSRSIVGKGRSPRKVAGLAQDLLERSTGRPAIHQLDEEARGEGDA